MSTPKPTRKDSPDSRRWIIGAIAGAALYWLSQPPLGWWPLAFLAPLGWLPAIVSVDSPGKRGYWALWLSGSAYWLLTMQGTRLSHPALYPCWMALGFYLGAYFPLFVGLSRVAIHRYRIPLLVAAPVVWMGLELIRSYAFTGFSAAMLGHAIAPWTAVFQVSDLFGSYTVSGLAIVFAVGLFQAWRAWRTRGVGSWKSYGFEGTLGIVALPLAWGYGVWSESRIDKDSPAMIRVALLQADEPAIFEPNAARDREAFRKYLELSAQAGALSDPKSPTELLVWPESMFGAGQARYSVSPDGFVVPEDVPLSEQEFQQEIERSAQEFDVRAQVVLDAFQRSSKQTERPWLLAGAGRVEYTKDLPRVYGVALIYDASNRLVDWYGKRHLVMFGEYIPFGDWFPWLYKVLPLNFGTTPGPKLLSVPIGEAHLAPSICFETMVEHVANRQVRTLRREGQAPDVLINITNDGWFHGSSILDHHRRCTQAIAAAHHVPILVAANSGLTVWIDGSGRIVQELPRQTEGILMAYPKRDGRTSLYAYWGDWPVCGLALINVLLGVAGWRERRSKRAL